MKLQNKFLFLAAASLVLSGQVFAGVTRTVTISGSAILTYPANTSGTCLSQLQSNGCSGQGCSVGGKTLTFNVGNGDNECSGISLTLQGGSGRCSNSQAEVFLAPSGNTYDISGSSPVS